MIGFFIMVNLFLASVYDSFMLHTSIKDKSKKQPLEVEKQAESPNFFLNLGNIEKKNELIKKKREHEHETHKERNMKISTIPLHPKFTISNHTKENYFASCKDKILKLFENDWFRRFISLLIIGDIIVLCLDGHPIGKNQMIFLHKWDFFYFCCFFVEINAKIFAIGIIGIKKSLILLIDTVIIYANFIVILYEISEGFDLFEEGSRVGIAIKTLKMIRIFRVLYYTQLLSSLGFIISALVKTLNKMRQFFFIMAVLVIVLALMGMQIFSNRARFVETHEGGIEFEM